MTNIEALKLALVNARDIISTDRQAFVDAEQVHGSHVDDAVAHGLVWVSDGVWIESNAADTVRDYDRALSQIDAALAQAEQPDPASQRWPSTYGAHPDRKAEQAQPAATTQLMGAIGFTCAVFKASDAPPGTPVYLAAPPAAQPLTDADIEAVMGPCEGSAFAEHLRREFVKSFKRVYFKLHPERAHGIGQPPEARFGYMDGDEA